jgi:hypothetical protein
MLHSGRITSGPLFYHRVIITNNNTLTISNSYGEKFECLYNKEIPNTYADGYVKLS